MSATSAHSLETAPSSTRPPASVTEDDPILATTITDSPPSAIGLVGEREATYVHHIALPGAGPGQSPIDPQPVQSALDVVEGLGVGEIVHGHGPLGRPATNHEPTVVGA